MLKTPPQPSGDERRHRFTVAEFEKMHRAGAFPQELRLELLEGEVFEMPPMGDDRVDKLAVLNEELVLKLREKARILCQVPLRTAEETSLPEPDFAVIDRNSYPGGVPHAEQVRLVVEISDTTLAYDRGRKLRVYARNKVPEVWILDVKGKQLEVYRDPQGEDYRSKQTYDEGDEVAPAAFPETPLRWW